MCAWLTGMSTNLKVVPAHWSKSRADTDTAQRHSRIHITDMIKDNVSIIRKYLKSSFYNTQDRPFNSEGQVTVLHPTCTISPKLTKWVSSMTDVAHISLYRHQILWWCLFGDLAFTEPYLVHTLKWRLPIWMRPSCSAAPPGTRLLM